MRRILGSWIILAVAAPVVYAYEPAQGNGSVPSQEPFAQTSRTYSPANAVQTPGGTPAAYTPLTPAATTTGTTTTTAGAYVSAAQPVATSGTTTYYSYPQRPFFGLFRRNTAPTYYYTTGATQSYATAPQTYNAPQTYYYTPVRRMWPFGMYQRRYSAYPATAYTTSGYYATPGYAPPGYGSPTSYGPTTYIPTTYNAPVGTAPSGAAAVPAPGQGYLPESPAVERSGP